MRVWLATLCLLPFSCSKVPIFDVEAGFTLADLSWFAEEETLFVFYEMSAQQGLGEPSVIEITWATDTERVPWTPIDQLEAVHTHVPVDCGEKSLCGSTSLHIPLEPREVDIRLRYHRDGALALDADAVYNVVGLGPAHTHRSMVVYGVFEETNQRVQWRGRHQFPTVRNHEASRLGLRRDFRVREQRFGTASIASPDNPYGYGAGCPNSFVLTQIPAVETNDRAVFSPQDLPLGASDSSTVCGTSTVTDAKGNFTTTAIARKNPEIRDAFPVLRSPIRDARVLRFFLAPCNRVISTEHEEMQRQRLLMQNTPTTCIDDWEDPNFVDRLVQLFGDEVNRVRSTQLDMVLLIGLHQDEPGVSLKVEQALAQLVPQERLRSSPRLAGAAVFDSEGYPIANPQVATGTLWCPSTISPSQLPDVSSYTCPVLPDLPDLNLGPLDFGILPVLPPRDKYLEFIDDFSVQLAGSVETLRFLTPEFAATTDHIDFGLFGVATFLNGETISADADDAFSFCAQEELPPFQFRSAYMQSQAFRQAAAVGCLNGSIPFEVCQAAQTGFLSIDWLPAWHNQVGESDYEVGIAWEFPFLVRMQYRAVVAGSVTAVGFTVPFGVGNSTTQYFGTELWMDGEYPLEPALTHCRRFCDHPTFDSAGVYHVTDPFRTTYARSCYFPDYPMLADLGFPFDP